MGRKKYTRRDAKHWLFYGEIERQYRKHNISFLDFITIKRFSTVGRSKRGKYVGAFYWIINNKYIKCSVSIIKNSNARLIDTWVTNKGLRYIVFVLPRQKHALCD